MVTGNNYVPQEVMPDVIKDPRNGILKFRSWNHLFQNPMFGVADFESALVDHYETIGDNTITDKRHVVVAFSLWFVSDVPGLQFPRVDYRGRDAGEKFVKELRRVAHEIWRNYGLYGLRANRGNYVDNIAFNKETHCFACGCEFVRDDDKRKKCFDHDHYTGKYRSAMCNSCNRQCRDERRFPIFFHNFSGYDSHLLLRELNKLDDGDFTALPRNEEKFVSITKGVHVANETYYVEIKAKGGKNSHSYDDSDDDDYDDDEDMGESDVVFSKDGKKMMKMVRKKFVHFDFKDSYSFCNSSIETLAKNLEEKDFEPMRKEYGESYNLLTRKQVFPYRFLTGLKCMRYEGLIPKEGFGSRLGRGEVFLDGEEKEVKVCPISDEDYAHYVKVMTTFGIRTFGEYVSLYCASDTILLGIIMKRFTETCMRDFGVDPTQSFTAPGFFWKAMLRMTGVEIELLTDREKYVFFEKCIRGGVSVVSNRYAKANNPYMKDYDKKESNSYIMEWYANSLYASVMVEELPIGGFMWAGGRDLNYLERMLREGNDLPSGKGASLCVDLDYPEHLHERDSDYPLAPEKVIINGVEKLSPNLGNKREYHTTYELLLYYLRKGLVLKKVHSAITF